MAGVVGLVVASGCAGPGAMPPTPAGTSTVSPAGSRVSPQETSHGAEQAPTGTEAEGHGPRVVSGSGVLVRGDAPASVVAQVRDAAVIARRRCSAAWPEPLPVLRVEVSADPEPDGGGVTASTIVVGDAGVGEAHVRLATAAVDRLTPEGLRVVLTHECVHVALATRRRPTPPMWLVEGTADVIAYARSGVSEASATAPLVDRVAAEGPPRRLPPDADFLAGSASDRDRLRSAYAQAHTAARVYADRHGTSALLRLLIDGPGPGGYGRVETEVLPAWQAELRRRAADVEPAPQP